MKKIFMIMALILATMAVTGCGNYSVNKGNDQSVDNSTNDNSTNNSNNTTTNNGGGEYNATSGNDTTDLQVPPIDAYSTGKVVLDCSNPLNVRGIAAYKCLKPSTSISLVSNAHDIVETDRYKTEEDVYVLEFGIDSVDVNDTITVIGVVSFDDNSTQRFAEATCKVGE